MWLIRADQRNPVRTAGVGGWQHRGRLDRTVDRPGAPRHETPAAIVHFDAGVRQSAPEPRAEQGNTARTAPLPLTPQPRRASLGAHQPRRRGGGLVSAPSEVAFIAFGLGSQAILAAFFAARRWRPRSADRYGRLAYAVAGLGLPLGIWFLAGGNSWRLYAGPMMLGCWAVFGSYLDLWRKVEWRSPPRPGLLVPYVALYFWGADVSVVAALGPAARRVGSIPGPVCCQHRPEPHRACPQSGTPPR